MVKLIKKALVIHYQGGSLIAGVSALLKKYNVSFSVFDRAKIKSRVFDSPDLIIVIGGDGTFLRASHFNKNKLQFGINPDPDKKEGFFMQSHINDYREKLSLVLEKKHDLLKVLRLEAYINGKKAEEISLNEIYIGDKKPYNMFNYVIKIGSKEEFQRSSGIIIGGPAGSHAWIKSAGGKALSLSARKFQFVARELYEGRLAHSYKLRKGILDESKEIIIEIKSPGILVMDSVGKEHLLDKGDIVKIRPSPYSLLYPVFPGFENRYG